MTWNNRGKVVGTLGTFMRLKGFVITERNTDETSDFDEDPKQYKVGDAEDTFTEMGGYPVLHPEETGALYHRRKHIDCECIMRTAFGYVRPISGKDSFWYREDQATLCEYCNPQLELDL